MESVPAPGFQELALFLSNTGAFVGKVYANNIMPDSTAVSRNAVKIANDSRIELFEVVNK